jgi:hypothetical protein
MPPTLTLMWTSRSFEVTHTFASKDMENPNNFGTGSFSEMRNFLNEI